MSALETSRPSNRPGQHMREMSSDRSEMHPAWTRGAWHSMTCALAARHGHLDVLKWAIRNHAPFSADDLIQIAEKYEQDGVLRWLAANVASFY